MQLLLRRILNTFVNRFLCSVDTINQFIPIHNSPKNRPQLKSERLILSCFHASDAVEA